MHTAQTSTIYLYSSPTPLLGTWSARVCAPSRPTTTMGNPKEQANLYAILGVSKSADEKEVRVLQY